MGGSLCRFLGGRIPRGGCDNLWDVNMFSVFGIVFLGYENMLTFHVLDFIISAEDSHKIVLLITSHSQLSVRM
jgi:hypothetical protein